MPRPPFEQTWNQSVRSFPVLRLRGETGKDTRDSLAVEEPLEIRLAFGPKGQRRQESLSITMRTPGHDFELALGFLFSEGLIASVTDVIGIRFYAGQLPEQAQSNAVLVDLHPELQLDWDRLNRHFYTTSSCGVCGKASIEMVRQTTCHFPRRGRPVVAPEVLFRLPETLRATQKVFEQTGGIHAAGLFDPTGQLVLLREDVGRHNALDKLLGAVLQQNRIPLSDHLLLVSGRASFELVQKALMAGIPFLAAVGAPSSLALELAEEYGMTLVGFLRDQGCNVYCGEDRITQENNTI
ncbi:MAG: formate dehydrogenase accessory sulfurtransferase FdhD [Saprospiraceae bacterium]|nr:formate dehydrogenase accessory sulfurtransferase FdhD [Saprospiraceae bacterium]MCB0682845.1 formate dehydrogenase accessory sulfurtransferase FdhD [Saprospiraceae bacterium]